MLLFMVILESFFMGLCIVMARFGPILVKQLLNVFALSVVSVTIYSLHINDSGKDIFLCVLERILFMVPPPFLMLVLKLLKQNSVCICFALRMLFKAL